MNLVKNLILTGIVSGICLQPVLADSGSKKDFEFIDERIIEHSVLLERRITPATKYAKNPITGESNGPLAAIKGKDGIIRMWYSGREAIPGEKLHNGVIPLGELVVRYAESKDGLHWTFPNLGLVKFRGSKDNNIIMAKDTVDKNGVNIGKSKRGPWNMCVFPTEGIPYAKGKYTLVGSSLPHGFAYSDDGLHWTSYSKGPRIGTWSDTLIQTFYDKRIGKYVLLTRPYAGLRAGALRPRCMSYLTSTDLVTWDWDDARIIFDPDGRDAPAVSAIAHNKAARLRKAGKEVVVGRTFGNIRGNFHDINRSVQVEAMMVIPYKGMYLGFPSFLYQRKRGAYMPFLVHSYDGINWIREADTTPFLRMGAYGTWDAGIIGRIAFGCPIQVGDTLFFYFGAGNRTHSYVVRSDKTYIDSRSVGVAYIKVGRFVGYHAQKASGQLLTRPFVLTGSEITLNADVSKGKVRVAVLSADGSGIEGYGKDDFVMLSGQDAVALPLKWKEKGNPAALKGKKIRLMIEVYNGAVYAFNVK